MIAALNKFITDVLNPFGVVLGIIVSLPIFWTWYEVIYGRKKRQRIYVKKIKQQHGALPSILVVDFKHDADIYNQFLRARQQEERLKDVPDNRIFHIKNDSWMKPEDMVGLVEDLRLQLGKIAAAGTDVLYFVYAGPVMPAAIIGAELANSCRVILFQHQQGQYVNWGPLRYLSS